MGINSLEDWQEDKLAEARTPLAVGDKVWYHDMTTEHPSPAIVREANHPHYKLQLPMQTDVKAHFSELARVDD